jgi:predicted O-linked N-acetylglucosamine transferase (SPINDLY family)
MALKIDPGYKAVYPYLAHSLMQQASWKNLDATIATMLANAEEELAAGTPTSATGFALMTTPASMDLRHRVACNSARHIAERVADIKRDLAFTYPKRQRKKICVGYLSPDFRFHSVAVAFRGLLDAYDRCDFEYYGYSLSPTGSDGVTEALRERFYRFTDVHGLSHRDAAKRIHDDGIDILVDLAGYTRFARLEILALQPAPIQAHYLGYSSTIGGKFLQYLITDHWQVAPGMERYFSEKLVYLPDCFMATTRAAISAEPVTRAECGLPEKGVVFADFNAHYKFEPRLWGIWMRLLKRVPGSVLWMLKGTQFSERNLRQEAMARGIDPRRLVFAERAAHPDHLARHQLVDIALDTLLHGGGVTTVDALWAGTPVVTVAGESPPSRNGASLLAAIGLEDLIFESIEAYEAGAFALATDPARLAAVKARLKQNRDTHPLFNTERLARHLEAAYRLMWRRWRDGKPPATINVPPLS